jgi:hypothetical protein
MPQKIKMFISNQNAVPAQIKTQINTANLAAYSSRPVSLNSSMISRIHNVRPGCGSCGKKHM